MASAIYLAIDLAVTAFLFFSIIIYLIGTLIVQEGKRNKF